MSIELHKKLMAELQANEETTVKQLFQKLQEVLNEITACGFIITCDHNDRTEKLTNAEYDFSIRNDADYANWVHE
jgi:recombinational DNA repair protein RecR